MSSSSNPIEQSFELGALRRADLTPLVYQRLFDQHPETRTMFRTQGSELVMGSMLALTIEAILDFAGERSGHFRLIACEVASHDAYGTPRAVHRLLRHDPGYVARTARQRMVTEYCSRVGTSCTSRSGPSPAAQNSALRCTNVAVTISPLIAH